MIKTYPTLEQVLSVTCVVSVPLVVKFRGVVFREAAIFCGPKRWAEFSPFLEYSDAQCARWLQAALEFGWGDLPQFFRTQIPINATVPAVSPQQVENVLSRFGGCETVKVKVAQKGQILFEDVERVRRVRQCLPLVKIRLDANGGWSVHQAREALQRLVEFDLEYVEQPVGSIDELVSLRKLLRQDGVAVLVAADESVRNVVDPFEVQRRDAADIVVLKVAPLGGVCQALAVAKKIALPVVVSSCLDTSVGVNMGLVLAAALPKLDFACGLGTVSLLGADVVEKSLLPVEGFLGVAQVNADVGLLKKHAVNVAKEKWWKQRITRAYQHLFSPT